MITGYKGFDANIQCRDFQYEIGKTYETTDTPIRCTEKGFHLCENPLDVFRYYPPGTSRYAQVEGDGLVDRRDADDSKVAVSRLHVGAEIDLHGLISAGVKFILDRVKWDDAKKSNTGDRSAATNTGNWSAATNTGNWSAASVEGKESVALAMGYQSKAKGVAGCWLVLAEWDAEGRHILDVQCHWVDGETVKADTWYQLQDGAFVAVQ